MNIIIYILSALSILTAILLAVTRSLHLGSVSLGLIGVAAILSGLYCGTSKRYIGSSKLQYLVVIALSYFLCRALLSPVLDLARGDLVLILLSGCLYFVATTAGAKANFRRLVVTCVILASLIHLAASYAQLLDLPRLHILDYLVEGFNENGVSGWFGYYGTFANLSGIVAYLCLSLSVWSRLGRYYRLSLATIGVLAVLAVVFSCSRAGILGLLAGGCCFLFLLLLSSHSLTCNQRKSIHWISLVPVVLGAVSVIVGGLFTIRQRSTDSTFAQALFDSEVRLSYWKMAIEQAYQSPIFGAGSRSYSYESLRLWSEELQTRAATPEFVHNEYLQLLADYGVVGFLFVVGVVACHFFWGCKRVYNLSDQIARDGNHVSSDAMAYAIAGCSGIAVMAVHILLDFPTHTAANLVLLVCCLVWCLPITKKGASCIAVPKSIGRGFFSAMLILLGLLSLWIAVPEVRVASYLLKCKGFSSISGWDAASVSDPQLATDSYEDAYSRSPNYEHAYKLATIHHMEAVGIVDPVERENAFEKALIYYSKAEQRHPYFFMSALNQALINIDLQSYESAEKAFIRAEKYGAYRESHTGLYKRWAELCYRQGRSIEQENREAARVYYLRAVELNDQSASLSASNRYRDWYIQQAKYLYSVGATYDSLKEWHEAEFYFEQAKALIQGWGILKETRLHYKIGQFYYKRAEELWMGRQIDRAVHCYTLALSEIANYNRMTGRSESDAVKLEESTIEVLKYFEMAGLLTD
ncbi:O-antigen ligase family protein [Persicirhabdus sediminis]|uniref:O-antigen ligase family protein n=1 Tax=Persicirhabdus sediminis TaxID=454144 RepID=A0A8J7SQ50_9BACT|nr:O-antigen ligase family protein [Persicirhabdus sediminis]MBK1792768.1 O-antigen ligase family protein [Persicirhabdus sediminis]